jgi:hypothetical protein
MIASRDRSKLEADLGLKRRQGIARALTAEMLAT